LAVGEETSVVVSESHPWLSSFKPRQINPVILLGTFGMFFFECILLVALISPRSLDGLLNVKPRPPNLLTQRFIHQFLLDAQKDGATEIIVGTASPFGVPVRYKVKDTWREMPSYSSRGTSSFGSHGRRGVVSELVRMVGARQIPAEGILDESPSNDYIRLRWSVVITSLDGEFTLKRVDV
jgi:hypothetical protein